MEALNSCEIDEKIIINDKINDNTNNINNTNNKNIIKETTSLIITEITFQEIIDRLHN